MKKNEYIEKAKNSILNRVRFHAPIAFDADVDRRLLFENNIDANLPIFKFDKKLDKNLLRAFLLAKREEKFNLLLSTSSVEKLSNKALKDLDAVIFSPINSSARYIEMINKLNINYASSSNYNLKFKDKFVKINGQTLNPKFDEFELVENLGFGKVLVDYHEFVLNGTNIFLTLKNYGKNTEKIEFEINLPLKKGYYYFKNKTNTIFIENLLNKEKFCFNFLCKNAKFSFSNVDGLENSVFCCINAKVNFVIKAGEEKILFFNFSDAKLALKNKREIEEFKKQAYKKTCEVFDVKVKTNNQDFDQYFNNVLPRRIWVEWLNLDRNIDLENKYLNYRRMFVRGDEKKSLVNFKEIGLKEIGIFNGEYYKKIYVVLSHEKFLKVGKTHYFNFDNITNFSLKNRDPISISFGE